MQTFNYKIKTEKIVRKLIDFFTTQKESVSSHHL